MSSSAAPDAAESRRAGKEPVQEPESKPQRKWVALVSAADLLADEDEPRDLAIGDRADVLIDEKDPPLPSRLALQARVAADPRRNDGPLSAYILAADYSTCILVQVVEGTLPDFFLCNTRSRSVAILPPVSAAIQNRGHDIRQHRSMGLIADRNHPGHYVVAQLHPSNLITTPNKLLYYSTARGRWFIRELSLQLQQGGMRNPFSETVVLAHDDRLWWVALAYGVFFCDPCTPPFHTAKLSFLALPEDCEMEDDAAAFDPRIRTLLDQRRCVRLSEGKLRFVEIRGLSYVDDDIPAANPTVCMWTLDDPEGQDPWTREYEVAFAEIWDSDTYAAEGLPREVPHVALVDPDNHFVVYFFQGSRLFGFHMDEKKVVACKECPIDRDQVPFRSSRPIIDAWVPPPPLAKLSGDGDYSSPDDNVWSTQSYAEQKKLEATKSAVHDWLDKARLEWTRDTDASFENWRAWKISPPTSDEESVNSGDQAGDEVDIDNMWKPLSILHFR